MATVGGTEVGVKVGTNGMGDAVTVGTLEGVALGTIGVFVHVTVNGSGDTVEVNVTGMVGIGDWTVAVNVETEISVVGSVAGNSVETVSTSKGEERLDTTLSVVYSICRRGAPAASPSYVFAVRKPLPVKMITIEFPGYQSGLLIIS